MKPSTIRSTTIIMLHDVDRSFYCSYSAYEIENKKNKRQFFVKNVSEYK